jgi:hypothetical protein
MTGLDLAQHDVAQVLLVSDWVADAEEVADAARQALPEPRSEITIVVPAWLHGLDWAGDPEASIPCATRHLELLTAACRARGLHVAGAAVGDPHPASRWAGRAGATGTTASRRHGWRSSRRG